MFYGFVITEAGNKMMAEMVAGETMTITRVVMDKGTAADAEAARALTGPIDPGPEGTSTEPMVDGHTAQMIVEYRSDLNGGLKEGFWIGGFGVYGKTGGAEAMIYYGSLGDARQYVSAYVEGTAPDVRRYPVAITVTDGVQVDTDYPAEAWMTAEDVAEYFNNTIKPELEESLGAMVEEHNESGSAHKDIRAELLEAKQEAESARDMAEQAMEAAEQGGGRCVLQLTFDSGFSGQIYTVTGGENESYTGTVPTELAAEVSVKDCETTYTVTAQNETGISHSVAVETGPYFGQYQAHLEDFAATLIVTAPVGSTITAVNGDNQYTGTIGETGSVSITVYVSGTYTVTATLDGESTTGTVEIAENGESYNIALAYVQTTLNDNSWETIKKVSDAGQGANYWDVGDTKAITINGTVGATSFTNLSINVFILGFNHNASREGTNRIHFKIGKIGDTQVGLCDSSYGSSTSTSGKFTMNTSNTNSGGWANCHMRKTVLGSDATPTSPRANTLLAALPADLRAVMKPITKYSDNTGGGSNTASYVTSTTDYLPLLSEFEYHGTRTYANSAEQNYQQQYAYYQAGNSKVHYKHDATGTEAYVLCRSVNAGGTYNFCRLDSNGSADGNNASYSWAVAPGLAA